MTIQLKFKTYFYFTQTVCIGEKLYEHIKDLTPLKFETIFICSSLLL